MTCFSFFFSRKKAGLPPEHSPEIDEEVSGIQNTKLFTYRELKMATGNFHFSNKIGEGGFGAVYKGTFRDGTMAAIKVLSADSRQGVREFLTEINVIAEIEHENLVELCGCCVEGNHRILVYGYLENNSLAQTLLDRLFAFALLFQLSNNLPNLCVFLCGLCRGYLAPEYAIRGQLTRKADIYSFGVLLLEIVSGRSNTNRRLPLAEQYLLERAWDLYERGELAELVDTSMNGHYNVEECQKFLMIGLLCTQDMPKLRPSMSEVVKMLTGETAVDGQNISRPGLLSEFMSLRGLKDKSDMGSEGTGREANTSSSSENITTSYATMTFNSIFDRSN
ncbi:hypothetical protein CCACVL1_16450 [Corchorus capsularis]|uniref:Protein kinase domain-containing protein n=1 Tax=Corchorus capsularis TaxID=210143 RepID=A0A1R3HWS6_COCAP|nr:hypothetical protein CCACVL1_16450 [Corchorus capsularis]